MGTSTSGMGRCLWVVMVGALAWTGAAKGVWAVDSTWTSTVSGNWSDPTRWNNGVPGATTNAFLTNNVATSYTATNDLLNNTIGNLTIYNLGTGTNTLWNGANGFNPTGIVIIGRNGAFDVGGFTATVGGSLIISNLGRLIVTNGSLLSVNGYLASTGTLWVGSGGTIAVGVLTNTGFITTQFAGSGGGIITGSVANLRTTGGLTVGTGGINVLGGATDSSLSLVGPSPFAGGINLGSIVIASNGTLNVGGTDASSATASFTNRSTIGIIGGAALGSRMNMLNAGVLVNDTNGTITMVNSTTIAGLTNYINADVINHGTLTLNSAGPHNRLLRSLVNFGSVDFGGLANAITIIQQGTLTNAGRLTTSTGSGQSLIITNGGLVNTTNATVNFNRTTVRTAFLDQHGTLNVTNSGVVSTLFDHSGARLSFTNHGAIHLFTADLSIDVATLVASNVLNRGTISIVGKTNITAQGIPSTQVTWMDAPLTNDTSGFIHVRTNALAALDRPFVNLGTVSIQSNSVFSIGHSGVGANQVAARGSPTNGTANFRGAILGWTNHGTVQMESGSFLAVASLSNAPTATISGGGHIGHIHFRTITNLAGSITQYVRNVSVAHIGNAGLIAPNGILNVGVLSNLSGGRIIGIGTIQSINVTNFFDGSTLITSNVYTDARLFNAAGATVLASGGTLILSNGLLHNSNFGTLGATNGLLQLGDGTLPLTNNAGATLYVYRGGLNLGALRNSGTVQIVDSIVTFSNPVVNAGRYLSDPSTNIFLADVTIEPAGTLEGGAGDRFDFRGSLFIHSTNSSLFDLASSTVAFSGGGSHTNAITGLDLGPTYAGLTAGNFAYGALDLSSLDNLVLTDGDGIGSNTNALYIGGLDLGGSTNNVSLLESPFNIYYDPGHALNAYLGAQTYSLSGGGFLIPLIPEPHTGMLLGAAALLLRVRRRHPCQVRQGAGGRA